MDTHGTSGNLRPKSQQMKEVFEQTAHMPTVQQHPHQHPPQQPVQQPVQQQAAPQPAPQPVPLVQQVTPEQAAAELQQVPESIQPPMNPNQMEFNLSEPTVTDKLIDLLKEQNLLLKEISLKLDNGKKTTKGRKQS